MCWGYRMHSNIAFFTAWPTAAEAAPRFGEALEHDLDRSWKWASRVAAESPDLVFRNPELEYVRQRIAAGAQKAVERLSRQ